MPATETKSPLTHQPDLSVAVQGEGQVVNMPRGKTVLSLAELEGRITHYPEEIRAATRMAQAFFVEHCDSNIEQFLGVAKNALRFERSPQYFSNWIKGAYFLNGGGKLPAHGKGYSDWLGFCEGLSEYRTKLKTGGKIDVTGTIRAIESAISEVYDLDNPCRIGGVSGNTGSQKTAGMKYVALKRGGFPYANYLNCTEGLGVSGFKRALGDLFNCKVGNKAGVIERQIGINLGPDRGLFIDNIQRAVDADEQSVVIDFILRMQEDRNFPLFLSFTKEFKKGTLTKNTFLEQLVGRMGGMSDIVDLPDVTPVGDLRVIARNRQLADTAVDDYLKPWSRQEGKIRIVYRRLWRAKQFAMADGKDRITLDYLKEVDTYVPPASLDDEGGAL